MIEKIDYEWDNAKNQINREKHSIDFEAINLFNWDTAEIITSDRHNEIRFAAIGYIADSLYFAVYTIRGNNRRIISLRKASSRERAQYERLRRPQ